MNNFLTKKVERKTTDIERKVKKIGKKVRFYGVIGAALIGCGLAIYIFLKINAWSFENKVILQSPIIIKIQLPFRIEHKAKEVKKATVMPLKEARKEVKPRTEFEIVTNTKYGDILWNIYQLESQRGLTDSCRLKGNGYGGFGVMDDKGVACYETFEKTVERASYWLGRLKPEKNLVSALCQWNLGVPNLVNCHYYQDYISL